MKPIKGYEGIFSISKNGRVWSHRRLVVSGIKYSAVTETGGGFLKSRINNHGYLVIHLSHKGKQKNLYIHRLVALSYIPNPENKPQVNHIDGNPLNNKISNLEWCTPKENVHHAIKIGLFEESKKRMRLDFVPNGRCKACGVYIQSKKNKIYCTLTCCRLFQSNPTGLGNWW